MENNLLNIDSAFTKQYKELLEIQYDIYKKLKHYTFDLNKTEITDAIIARMDAFWYFNVKNNKDILNRKTNTTAADFFTETCLLFIKSYFKEEDGYKVFSEENILHGREEKGIIRPDISIRKNNKLIAVIELKVSNGWKGAEMLPHLKDRESKILKNYPNIFFGVIAFWNFFNSEIDGWGNKYIGLKTYDEKNNHPKTNANIENMIIEIEKNEPLIFEI